MNVVPLASVCFQKLKRSINYTKTILLVDFETLVSQANSSLLSLFTMINLFSCVFFFSKAAYTDSFMSLLLKFNKLLVPKSFMQFQVCLASAALRDPFFVLFMDCLKR